MVANMDGSVITYLVNTRTQLPNSTEMSPPPRRRMLPDLRRRPPYLVPIGRTTSYMAREESAPQTAVLTDTAPNVLGADDAQPQTQTSAPEQELVLPSMAGPNTPPTTDATTTVLQDSNLAASTLQGALTINLSDLINSIPVRLVAIKSDNMSTVLTFKSLNLELTNLYVPPINLQRYYELDKFNSNFKEAFGQAFPVLVESQILFGVTVSVLNNLPFASQTFLEDVELAAFRQITCLLFGLLFNLNLGACTCFPKNLNELKAVNAGLGLNCVNLECRNMLKTNPLLFDDLVHTDCTDLMFNAAFVSLNLFAGKNIDVDINLDQGVGGGARARAAATEARRLVAQDVERSAVAAARVLEEQLWALERFYSEAVPVGAFFAFSGAEVPRNYLVCRGQRVRRRAYPELARAAPALDAGRGVWGLADAESIVLPSARPDSTLIIKVATAER